MSSDSHGREERPHDKLVRSTHRTGQSRQDSFYPHQRRSRQSPFHRPQDRLLLLLLILLLLLLLLILLLVLVLLLILLLLLIHVTLVLFTAVVTREKRHAACEYMERMKLTQYVVVLGHRTLALEDLDEHRGLVVLVGGERLRLLRRDNGVTADDLRHHSADSLDTLLSAI